MVVISRYTGSGLLIGSKVNWDRSSDGSVWSVSLHFGGETFVSSIWASEWSEQGPLATASPRIEYSCYLISGCELRNSSYHYTCDHTPRSSGALEWNVGDSIPLVMTRDLTDLQMVLTKQWLAVFESILNLKCSGCFQMGFFNINLHGEVKWCLWDSVLYFK